MNNGTGVDGSILKGSAAVPGIAVGKAHTYRRSHPEVSEAPLADEEVAGHLEAFREGVSAVERELHSLAEAQHQESVKELLHAQIEVLNDPDLHEQIEEEIKSNNCSSDAAVSKVFDVYLELLDERREKATTGQSVDITDIRDRLIQVLHNQQEVQIESGTILVARELSPREIIDFASQEVKGVILERGAPSSHAVILARALQIPMMIGVEKACEIIPAEQTIILDAREGKVLLDSAPQMLRKYQEAAEAVRQRQLRKKRILEQPGKTIDGHPFTLRANIGFAEELDAVTDFGAEGIGLLRTETAYLNRGRVGSEQNQRAFYQLILEKTDPFPATLRLFDAGGDKFFNLGQQEQNPYLGWRGIRMLLDEETMLRKQLRAMMSVAGQCKGRVRILVPMISSVDEVKAVQEMVHSVQQDMKSANEPVDPDVPLGIMVEVPAVALQAEQYAGRVDFLSIGTNDLTQYLLAVDRGNDYISKLYNQRHPVVWQMIRRVAEAGRAAGTPVSVCGELASDPAAACVLLGLGISELSMTPSALLSVKELLCANNFESMKQLAGEVLQSATISEVEQLLDNFKQDQTQ